MNRASPWYVPYLTKTLAFDEPRSSDPSTYTELHDDETYKGVKKRITVRNRFERKEI